MSTIVAFVRKGLDVMSTPPPTHTKRVTKVNHATDTVYLGVTLVQYVTAGSFPIINHPTPAVKF